MKIFLTGQKQSGRRTVIYRTVKILSGNNPDARCRTEGLETFFLGKNSSDIQNITYTSEEKGFSDRSAAAGETKNRLIIITEDFDEISGEIKNNLIIRDEHGFSEKNDLSFEAAIFHILETQSNVLGILRDDLPGWTSELAKRKDVLIIRVTEENRDILPGILAGCILHERDTAAIIMASGHGKRFGSNKLLTGFRGKPLIENLMEKIPCALFSEVLIVSIYDEILDLCQKYDIKPVLNTDTTDDSSVTIKTGLKNFDKKNKGCMFIVGDQPLLKSETIIKLLAEFYCNPDKICLLNSEGHRGNPVIFPNSFFGELMSLQNNQSGRAVIRNHPEEIIECRVSDSSELFDVDFPEDLYKLLR